MYLCVVLALSHFLASAILHSEASGQIARIIIYRNTNAYRTCVL